MIARRVLPSYNSMNLRNLCTAFSAFAASLAKTAKFELEAQWQDVSFKALLLETVSLHNSTVYYPLLSEILAWEDSNGPFENEKSLIDFMLEFSHSSKGIASEAAPLIMAELALKEQAAFLEAHASYFLTAVKPEAEARGIDISSCDNVMWYNGKYTCDITDAFAFKSTDKPVEAELFEHDRVIGFGANVPWAILYADMDSEEFPKWHANLLASALEQKIYYVLRYKPKKVQAAKTQKLAGYGVGIQLKRTDYLVIDDRPVNDVQHELKLDVESNKVPLEDVPSMPHRAANYILQSRNRYEALLDVGLNLPSSLSKFKNFQPSPELDSDQEANSVKWFAPGTNMLFVNESPLDPTDINVYSLLEAIREHTDVISDLERWGVKNASKLFTHEVVEGVSKDQIQTRYDMAFDSGAIVWLNNLELDSQYKNWDFSVETLVKKKARGLPKLRRNLHTLVFAVDLDNHLTTYFMAQAFRLIAGLAPIQIGIVPVGTGPKTDALLRVVPNGPIATQAFMVSLLQGISTEEAEMHAQTVVDLEYSKVKEQSSFGQRLPLDLNIVNSWKERLQVYQPMVFANGYPLSSTDWILDAMDVFQKDTEAVASMIKKGKVDKSDDSISLRSLLQDGAVESRNGLIDPFGDTDITYIDTYALASGLEYMFATVSASEPKHAVWIIANFETRDAWEQLGTLLNCIDKHAIKLQVIPLVRPDIRTDSKAKAIAAAVFTLSEMSLSEARKFVKESVKYLFENSGEPPDAFMSLLNDKSLPFLETQNSVIVRLLGALASDHTTFIIDGRLIVVDELVDSKTLDALLKREENRLNRIWNAAGIERVDYFAEKLTNAWYSNNRITTSEWAGWERAVQLKDPHAKVRVTAIVDPGSQEGQEIIALVEFAHRLKTDITVFLSPKNIAETGTLPMRFFKGVYPSELTFTEDGHIQDPSISFENLQDDVLYSIQITSPAAWVVFASKCDYDLDNLILNTVSEDTLSATHELKSILLEGHAFDETRREPPSGVQLSLNAQACSLAKDTMIMANLGYFQLQAHPGQLIVELKKGGSRDIFEFRNSEEPACFKTWLTKMTGLTEKVYMRRKPGKEDAEVLRAGSSKSSLMAKLGSVLKPKSRQADINIFTVASGHLYERFLSIMTLSVMKHTTHTVKFWLIENFLSPSFKEFLPELARKYGFEYEFVTYKWPHWLRRQTEKQREIWGYKILFLDVLFPLDLSKVIFVDSDQIVRTDLKELVDIDLHGAPYGFTPMGDDRKEMEGFRFWKQGYWKQFLRGRPYHISALYVVDLDRFRETSTGDTLRQHYQQLSADPKSLSNLDQDLPNNLQHIVPIYSLPQDWLWCETWCADEGLKTAKTIDLCNNPLTKEPKLDRARRQIPEWTEYDDAVAELRRQWFNRVHSNGTAGGDTTLVKHEDL